MRQPNNRPPFGVTPKSPLLVGGARNSHGTRICRKVTCQKCGVEDHITSRPKEGKDMLCRKCAQAQLRAFDSGIRVPKPMMKKRCGVCRCEFELPVGLKVRGDKPLCSNCMKGFDVWQGSLDMSPAERERMTLETRRSGTMLRRRS